MFRRGPSLELSATNSPKAATFNGTLRHIFILSMILQNHCKDQQPPIIALSTLYHSIRPIFSSFTPFRIGFRILELRFFYLAIHSFIFLLQL
ncbi:hypothetical protein TMatcc_004802 [Talaromyces marneffei ATCC 18224]|uniref:uncharacterized protein n=1 Tax=Talaromyces marneffei TaxID=37727 RepID=UPI0012A83DEA|nr:uncharacterized protein EYB26_000278 [Talaromyces marneffei]KAE8557349.1 hypothetical protein EYB25_002056 [Talaromyces marneffei]QGA12634.1 hypothetical protein EYB26_000278 [Talaromyces marneffei]